MTVAQIVDVIEYILKLNNTYKVEVLPKSEISEFNISFHVHTGTNRTYLDFIQDELRSRQIEFNPYNPFYKEVDISVVIRNP